MSLARRLDDAACGFLFGHTRRDHDRARRRRCELLTRRLIARLERRMAGDEFGFLDLAYGSLAQTLRRDVERLAQNFDRSAASRLAQQLDFDRAGLASRRRDERLYRDAVDEPDQAADDLLAVLPVAPDQNYGKLYHGLAQEGVRDLLLGKLRLCRRYGHQFLHLLKRFRYEACGPP